MVTGNYRSWRHFVAMRATEHADVEIRRLAVECLRQLTEVAPNAFCDFTINTLSDGTEVASGGFQQSIMGCRSASRLKPCWSCWRTSCTVTGTANPKTTPEKTD